MNWQDLRLIILAVAAILVLVLLVTRFKVNAFIALIAAALVVGGGAVIMGLLSLARWHGEIVAGLVGSHNRKVPSLGA